MLVNSLTNSIFGVRSINDDLPSEFCCARLAICEKRYRYTPVTIKDKYIEVLLRKPKRRRRVSNDSDSSLYCKTFLNSAHLFLEQMCEWSHRVWWPWPGPEQVVSSNSNGSTTPFTHRYSISRLDKPRSKQAQGKKKNHSLFVQDSSNLKNHKHE